MEYPCDELSHLGERRDLHVGIDGLNVVDSHAAIVSTSELIGHLRYLNGRNDQIRNAT